MGVLREDVKLVPWLLRAQNYAEFGGCNVSVTQGRGDLGKGKVAIFRSMLGALTRSTDFPSLCSVGQAL